MFWQFTAYLAVFRVKWQSMRLGWLRPFARWHGRVVQNVHETSDHQSAPAEVMRRPPSVFALRGSEHNMLSPLLPSALIAVRLDIPAAEVGATRARSVLALAETTLRMVFLLSWTHW